MTKGGSFLKKTCICAFACLFCLGACRGLYEGFRSAKAEDCYRLAYPEQEQCLQQINITYDEYEKERQGKKNP